MNRFLVATDLSDRSLAALDRAVLLAGSHGAVVRLLYVMPVTGVVERLGTLWPGLPSRDAEIQEKRRLLDELLHSRSADGETAVAEGTAFVEIIRQARESQADVIVVGAHGAHYYRDLLFGTTAERVVRKSDRPVLVVKRPPARPYRRVLVAVDFSEYSGEVLAAANRIAPEAELTVLNIYDDWFEDAMRRAGAEELEIDGVHDQVKASVLPELEEFVQKQSFGREVRQRVAGGYPGTAITREAQRSGADLVVLGARGHGAMYYALLGSTAERTVREAGCDVLTVRSGIPRLELP